MAPVELSSFLKIFYNFFDNEKALNGFAKNIFDVESFEAIQIDFGER